MRYLNLLAGAFALSALIACGGGDEAATEATDDETTEVVETNETATATATGALSTPAWMQIDEAERRVTLDIVAGETEANSRWNFNGLYAGNGEIVVPAGYVVTINFENADPNQPHSVGIGEVENPYPSVFENPTPVFAEAMTPNAATSGTAPGGTDDIEFAATEPGEYAMICYVPGHAVAGMVIPFTVSADGSAGVRQ